MTLNPRPSASDAELAYDDNAIVNDSTNAHLIEVASPRLQRRTALKGGLGLTAGVLLGGTSLTACGGGNDDDPAAATSRPLALGFSAVAKTRNDVVTVPAGYQVAVLHALGDPLHWGDSSWAGDGSEDAGSYDRRVGDGHDGMHFFGLSADGKFDATRSDRGLLCVNHEYVVGPFVLHPAGLTAGTARVATEVDKEIRAHGVSICEVQRGTGTSPAMSLVRGSRYGRRITSDTPMDFAGPARGHALLRSKDSPTGVATRGTNNNCANGYTPWGTYLTCEENYLNVISRAAGDDALRSTSAVTALRRYGLPQGRRSPYAWETAGTADRYARWNSAVTAASADLDHRHTINSMGWVVEIDPFQPDSRPVKRTALGRFNHEGAWPAPAVVGQPLVWYMGDDARNEYVYKYVSKAVWSAADLNGGLAAGAKYLDEGTLYVARFKADGTGDWVELTHGKSGLTAASATYPFADQGDVLINVRLAADTVGATKMDRPEWGAVNPRNGEVYMTMTNNSNRVAPTASPTGSQLKPDAANPRFYSDTFTNADGTTRTNSGNPNGHIVRWRETAGQAGTSFRWDIYLFGAQSDAAADVNLSGLSTDNDFSSPDGLLFDSRGMLWIQTDDGAYTDVTNCMMLAAVPGQVGDGAAVTAAGGTATFRGATATASTLRRFLVGPRQCEITGLAFTPDHKTMFVNVQHPGEDGSLATPASAWPASQSGPSTARPRSATVVIHRTDGGEIGL